MVHWLSDCWPGRTGPATLAALVCPGLVISRRIWSGYGRESSSSLYWPATKGFTIARVVLQTSRLAVVGARCTNGVMDERDARFAEGPGVGATAAYVAATRREV